MTKLRCGECDTWNCQTRLAPAYFCGDRGKMLQIAQSLVKKNE